MKTWLVDMHLFPKIYTKKTDPKRVSLCNDLEFH